MIILAIDTSCDDTCISILDIKNKKSKIRGVQFKILSNVVSSQVKIHQKYGGVYPSLAKREHQKNLPVVLKKTLNKAKKPKIDAVAVTIGPGLEPCLWTGINFAKDLAQQRNLSIILVNHIEAHIFANWLTPISSKSKSKKQKAKIIEFPAMCLVVSGGHTQLILMNDIGKYKIIGETRDDAAGECFDKTARVLGLPYPGGPAIATEAEKMTTGGCHPEQSEGSRSVCTNKGTLRLTPQGDRFAVKLPRPMINTKNYDFSFSGLKTAVLYDFKKRSKKVRASKEYVREMAKEIQQAIIDVLIKKTVKAAKDYQVKTIILGGGVVANQELRKQFQQKIKKEIPSSKWGPFRAKRGMGGCGGRVVVLIPDSKFCTDNAAMIGATAYFHRKEASKKWQKMEAKANLRINE